MGTPIGNYIHDKEFLTVVLYLFIPRFTLQNPVL